MEFTTGQKVRFLDENGEGIIVRMLDKDHAIVAIEHGFEIPYPVSKIVPAEVPDIKKDKSRTIETRKAVNQFFYSRQAEKTDEAVFLFYRPVDQYNILSSDLELMIVNNYPDDIHGFVYQKDGSALKQFFTGVVNKKESVTLAEIKRSELEKFCDLSVQLVFPASGKKFVPDAYTGEFRVKPVKFFKEGSFEEFSFFQGKVVALRVFPEEIKAEKPPEDFNLSKMILEKEKGAHHLKTIKVRGENELMEMEVDLHIEELIDSFRGLTNSEIITIQLNFFRKKLEEAIANNIRKVIFIHGVGNGRLKSEVRRILATYEGITFYDASFRRYGFGATEVKIR